MNKVFAVAAFAVLANMAGCASMQGFTKPGVAEKVNGTSGYAAILNTDTVRPEDDQYFHCELVESKDVCSNLSNYKVIGASLGGSMTHGGVDVHMLIPNSYALHKGDIVRFENAHTIGTWLLNAKFVGIARSADKTDKTCEFDGTRFGGKTVCNGWSSEEITNLW